MQVNGAKRDARPELFGGNALRLVAQWRASK